MDSVALVEKMVKEADDEIKYAKQKLLNKLTSSECDMVDFCDDEWNDFKTALNSKALLVDILDQLLAAE